MIFYWSIWGIYWAVCAVFATAGPLGNDRMAYYRQHKKNPSVFRLGLHFLMYLPFALFGQFFAPGPLFAAILGGILTLIFS